MKRITRFFIGPLTEAQRRQRERSREQFRVADDIAYTRDIPLKDALRAMKDKEPPVRYHGYATGEYP